MTVSRILVVDVSNVNGPVDWHRIARDGVKAAFLKASEGATFTDRTFAKHRAAAGAAGLRVGAYHFARPDGGDAADEARHFCTIVGELGRRDLRPALDLEASKLPMGDLTAWARAWNHVVKARLGCWPLFYSYSDFVRRMHPSRPIGAGLWLADYGRNDGREHSFGIPTPWRRSVAHQFTSRAVLPGVSGRVDESSVRSLAPLLAHPLVGLL